jgi:hypothetical protein
MLPDYLLFFGQPGIRIRLAWARLSALGQKLTCAVQDDMSALPPIATAKADIQKRR